MTTRSGARAKARTQGARADATAQWSQGYYCAVAVMLREEGCVTPPVRSVFEQGGGLEHIDPLDRALFVEHGLITTPSR